MTQMNKNLSACNWYTVLVYDFIIACLWVSVDHNIFVTICGFQIILIGSVFQKELLKNISNSYHFENFQILFFSGNE